jgi:hypothetical protein
LSSMKPLRQTRPMAAGGSRGCSRARSARGILPAYQHQYARLTASARLTVSQSAGGPDMTGSSTAIYPARGSSDNR